MSLTIYQNNFYFLKVIITNTEKSINENKNIYILNTKLNLSRSLVYYSESFKNPELTFILDYIVYQFDIKKHTKENPFIYKENGYTFQLYIMW